jgi:hypothetical protein
MVVLIGAGSACGGQVQATKPAVASSKAAGEKDEAGPAPSQDANKAKKPQAARMPTDCSKGGDGSVCLPPPAFATAMCNKSFSTVALYLFSKGTPWTRAYSRTRARAWNASGGGSSGNPMLFGEEVIVLRHRKPKLGGMQVSGAGASYDVLRWDGDCATLHEGELSFRRPSKVAYPRLIFRRFEPEVKKALKSGPLRPTYLKHRRACKGVTVGNVSKACAKLDKKFSRALAVHVSTVGDVPVPKRLPTH